jgi:hypothetical protein
MLSVKGEHAARLQSPGPRLLVGVHLAGPVEIVERLVFQSRLGSLFAQPAIYLG